MVRKDIQLYKFSAYGFLKNLRFFDPFIILFFREMGISFLQIGVLFSVREISTMILEIPTGIVADSFGRKNSMIFSFLSYIVSFLIFFLFPNYAMYILAMILYAFGEAFRTGTHKAMILEYLRLKNIEHLKVDYYGFTRSWSQKGSAVSSLIAGAIVFYSGQYKYIFVASVIPYILELFLMISYPKELNGSITKFDERNYFKNILLSFRKTALNFLSIFKNPTLLKAFSNSAVFDGLFKTVKDYIQPVMKSFALSLPVFFFFKDKRDTVLIAVVYFILYLLTSTASKNAGKFKRKCKSLVSAINTTYLVGVLIIVFAGLFYFLDWKIIAIIFFVLLFVIQNLRRPLNVGYLSEIIPRKVMASGLSAESQIKTFFVAIFAPIMGFLADKFGIGPGLMILSFLVLAVYPIVKLKK
ncbi:MAG: MFS transporter [Candidatus Cloacimonadota bacterium]|nr:MAG: MFS transporter [Candidatus Cloacimonadota bacterium]